MESTNGGTISVTEDPLPKPESLFSMSEVPLPKPESPFSIPEVNLPILEAPLSVPEEPLPIQEEPLPLEEEPQSENLIPKPKKYGFTCSTCRQKFDDKLELEQHLYYEHGIGIMCEICFQVCPSITAWITHIGKHSSEQYHCKTCDFKTSEFTTLKNHMATIHNTKGKISAEVENSKCIQTEGKSQQKPKPKPKKVEEMFCDICDQTFTAESNLMQHKLVVHKIKLTCEICKLSFVNVKSFKSHKVTKHTGIDQICDLCGYSTKKTYDFKRHTAKHYALNTIKCIICNKSFYSDYDYDQHKYVHTTQRPFQCEVCGVGYGRRSTLVIHQNSKHPEMVELAKKCHICGKVFQTEESMKTHLKSHDEPQKKFNCDICGKAFLKKADLNIHRRTHLGEKPFSCEYCDKSFTCKKNLNVHVRTHTGYRPYECRFCNRAYTKKSSLKVHEKKHRIRVYYYDSESAVEIKAKVECTEPEIHQQIDSKKTKRKKKVFQDNSKNEKSDPNVSSKVPCDICGQLYHKNLLLRHQKRHINARNSHKCEHCERSFTMMTKLILHKKNDHGLDMTCEYCEKKFQNVYAYTSHIRNHKKEKSYICDVCGFATIEKLTLNNHKLVKHQIGEFPLHCKICKKGFLSNYVLRDHINRHTGATPHQCHKCGSAYSSVRCLERHNYKFHPELFKNRLFRCKSCSRVFKNQKNLEAHTADKHPNGWKNVCDFCGKDFSFRESLIRHRRIHTGEKPKECSVCKKRFACATYLQSHMRTHTGEKPYQCRFCWKKFSQRSSMVTHEKSHLKGLKSSGLEIIPIVDKSQ